MSAKLHQKARLEFVHELDIESRRECALVWKVMVERTDAHSRPTANVLEPGGDRAVCGELLERGLQ